MDTKRRIVRMMTLVAVLGTLGVGLGVADAATQVKNTSTRCDDTIGAPYYCTIQAAVDAASPGDHIEVDDGTYTEHVTIPIATDSIHLDADGRVIIDCPIPTGTGITVLSDGNFVEDFDIINCNGFGGVGIEVSGNGNLIQNNEAKDNWTGIVVSGIGNKIEYNSVEDSITDGIRAIGGEMNVLDDNKLAGNGGWGIVITSTSLDNVVQDNKAVYNGMGGYLIDGTSMSASDETMLFDNDAEYNYGDGFRVNQPSGTKQLRHIHFLKNKAAWNEANGFNLLGNVFEAVLIENRAINNKEHGFSLSLLGGVRPRQTMLDHNVARGNTLDGFHLEGATPGTEKNVLMRNLAEANGEDGFDTDADNNGNRSVANDANGNTGAGMRDAGFSNIYTANDCAANGGGASVPLGLCN